MAEQDNKKDNVNNEKRPKPQKIINVTKPKQSSTPLSHIDATKVSSHTLREQHALEKLKKQVGGVKTKDRNSSLLKTIIAIVLAVILLALAVLFVLIIGRDKPTEEDNYDVRVSLQIENDASLRIVTESGKEKFKDIDPGDVVPVSAFVRNSDDYSGDNVQEIGESSAIFVRFKVQFVLNYKVANEKIKIKVSDKWYRYNKDSELEFGQEGILEDDGYYYYLGSLSFMQRAELFSEIEFVGEEIFCEDGGHYGQIKVSVESIHASLDLIEGENAWPTAPRNWILMQRNYF